jgi:hypothetical protein
MIIATFTFTYGYRPFTGGGPVYVGARQASR